MQAGTCKSDDVANHQVANAGSFHVSKVSKEAYAFSEDEEQRCDESDCEQEPNLQRKIPASPQDNGAGVLIFSRLIINLGNVKGPINMMFTFFYYAKMLKMSFSLATTLSRQTPPRFGVCGKTICSCSHGQRATQSGRLRRRCY